MIFYEKNESSWVKPVLILIMMLAGIPLISGHNFLLAHTVAEGSSLVIAFLIYVLSTRTYKFSQRYYLLFLGHVFLAVGVIDFFYILSLEGMGVFQVSDMDVAFKLRISARYILAVSLLAAPFAERLDLSSPSLFILFSGITAVTLISTLGSSVFPQCFIQGEGATSFMIISEYVVCLLMIMAMIYLLIHGDVLNGFMRMSLIVSMGLIILSEVFLTISSGSPGSMNIWGHIFKLVAFYLLYEGVAARGLDDPYEDMFQELRKSSIMDGLTGLYNRNGYTELSCKIWEYASRESSDMSLMVIDLDNFKQVNDTMGHRQGDRVLKKTGSLISGNTRGTDVVARIGGDEFVIVAKGDPSGLQLVRGRIQADLSCKIEMEELPSFIDMSFGISTIKPSGECIRDLEILFHEADQAMYSQKILKRGNPFASIVERGREHSGKYEKEEDL